MIEQRPVGAGRSVMELLDDDHVEVAGVSGRQVDLGKRLDGGEDLPPLVGPMAVDEELAEGAVPQGVAEGGAALGEDRLPVSDKQERLARGSSSPAGDSRRR